MSLRLAALLCFCGLAPRGSHIAHTCRRLPINTRDRGHDQSPSFPAQKNANRGTFDDPQDEYVSLLRYRADVTRETLETVIGHITSSPMVSPQAQIRVYAYLPGPQHGKPNTPPPPPPKKKKNGPKLSANSLLPDVHYLSPEKMDGSRPPPRPGIMGVCAIDYSVSR
jgi:hypothetical protein